LPRRECTLWAVISGKAAASHTGAPIGTALTLTVTRSNPDGSTVRLHDVTTGKDGTFSFRDSLPQVDPYQAVAETRRCSAGVLVPIDDRDRVESVSPLARRSPDARL
jgi:hypothetical protein